MNHQQVRDFFALNQTRPKKQLGQNFLTNPEVLKIIVEAGELTDTDTVIEIGAGLGCLTDVLVERAKRVIAVEVDELLYKALAARFGAACEPKLAPQTPTNARVQLFNDDILKLELNSLLSYGTETGSTTFKVIANLPYSITTPILWKLLSHHKEIHSCVLMMQKEVAERIVAGPGGKDYGALTIGVAYRADTALISTLSPENFYPAPKVDSALLKLTMRENPKVAVDDEELFFKIVRTAFRTRRKMLKNTLIRGRLAPAEVLAAAFQELGIAPQRRPETLDITEFAALTNFLSRS
ncbi:MAG: 16S rRNA (adenine(1518)-N(6)/adenine(1519)-N(6))-dimethyltransferase RsmA [Candidatus Poribacteria bacterium]|nr:16S rRNA (adenine(1518)-N(6)/adenine(1519)-N(6))-dimethyltransferase RsmA [Candidatus Poribacteria bacterium]